MQLKPLTPDQLSAVYREHMVFDFPKEELKPLAILQKCHREGTMIPYGLFDSDEIAAYAIMLFAKPGDACILDYLAAVRSRRGTGAGSEMLRRLQSELPDCAGILIEYEFPEDADGDERAMRLRREHFYLKNGVRKTRIDLVLFGVHFNVGYLPCARETDDFTLQQMQTAVYDSVNCWDYHFRPMLPDTKEEK